MSSVSIPPNAPKLIFSDTLSQQIRSIIELAKPYNTIILLYEDDFSDNVLAAWAELDRLNLKTRKIGQIYGGIEVHAFGLESFPPNTILELHIREASMEKMHPGQQRAVFKSLLNELSLISVKVYPSTSGSFLLE
jgi:hypothetical protein